MENGGIHSRANSIREDLPRMKGQSSSTVSIHRVPERLRRGENDAYEPRIISFGPYHHGETRLQAMEKYKWRYLEAILSRNPEIPLEHYINVIMEQEAEIRSCYSDDFDFNSSDFNSSEDFVKMMLMDGCFIAEYFLLVKEKKHEELVRMVWASPLIQYDILLLENQLPFFILNNIFDMAITKSSSINSHSYPDSFIDLAIYYLNWSTHKEVNFSPESVHHLLHLYHSFSLYTPKGEEERRTRTITIAREVFNLVIPNATALQEAGIRFKSTGLEGCSLDVTFNKGQIIIPLLVLNFAAMSKFRNLIAFEQFYPDFFTRPFYKSFTAYARFMDFIINTQDDVELLQEKGIIIHYSGSNKDVANLFNHLNQGTFSNINHYLVPLFKEIDKYMGKRMHKWRASLMHNYFNSPWSVLGVVAGGILLVLAFLQTYFSGDSAFPPPSLRPSH